ARCRPPLATSHPRPRRCPPLESQAQRHMSAPRAPRPPRGVTGMLRWAHPPRLPARSSTEGTWAGGFGRGTARGADTTGGRRSSQRLGPPPGPATPYPARLTSRSRNVVGRRAILSPLSGAPPYQHTGGFWVKRQPHDHHDWASESYVEEWVRRQQAEDPSRAQRFQLICDLFPFPSDAMV